MAETEQHCYARFDWKRELRRHSGNLDRSLALVS
jgi:hypothetical protein